MKRAFPPIIDSSSKILILGTMPSEKSLELQQYYGHSGNQFWKILFRLFDKSFSADYSDRVALLKSNHIALWDVLQFCEGIGSADAAIRNEIPNDFLKFHNAFPAIQTIVFASKQAEKFYMKHVGKSADLVYYVLPSPSGAYASMSFEKKLEAWRLIIDLLNK